MLKRQLLSRRSTLFVYLVIVITTLLPANTALAQGKPSHPFRGSVQLSIILCRYTDSGEPPRAPSYYRNMLITPGTGGMADYWSDISYGNFNLEGSVVQGWYTVPMTVSEARTNPRQNDKVATTCLDAARNAPENAYTVPENHFTVIVTYPAIDVYGGFGRAILAHDVSLGTFIHEIGHAFGLMHSFSDDPNYRNADWAQIGEYDDQWDLMSMEYSNPSNPFGFGGPGLNAYHVDRMGWLPLTRIYTFGSDGAMSKTVTLAALNTPGSSGFLLVRVPFDPADPFHYYTIELRRPAGWDSGIPQRTVLIHEIKKNDVSGLYQTYLLREQSGDRDPLQTVNANGVTIVVNNITADGRQATVTITGNIADRCLMSYVWREARPSDHVCVTPAIRQQTLDDNAKANQRRNPNGGPYGPDTCKQGFVWREAFPGDHVCVTRATRTQAQNDNSQSNARRNPARFIYGPNTCQQGYVWRQADSTDYVCVTPGVRTQTQQDNSLAAQRRNPNGGSYGPDTCKQGFVWREAFPGDRVCVTPQTRTQTWQDNTHAGERVLKW